MGYMNFFAAKLANDIGAADTTITLDTAPTALSGRMVLEARNPTQREVIKYTGVSGTQLTGVTRGQGGTTAKTHTQNSLVEMNLTSEDIQELYDAFDSFAASVDSWHNIPHAVSSVTANGNNSFQMVINGTDLTDTLSNGMRIRAERTVAAPNTAFSLDGSNDYYVKTSPNKLTFTDDFVCSAWVYLTSYAGATIISRYNGTSGWLMDVTSAGLVRLVGFNASSSNFRLVSSYQSLPLNRWVHVAAQLDMSAYTATTTTCYVMFDGVDVPASLSTSGTNPTALVQAGNLEVGSVNGGTAPFPGYIDQVAVYSAKVTQATILASINRKLSGTETSLASAYSNGSVNDLNTTTPNNLTATNGATTVANSPFGNRGVSTTLEYGVVMANTFSTNTTLTIQVPEGCQLPTTGGISSVDYSTQNVPYGFPRDKGRWQLEVLSRIGSTQGSPTANTWYNVSSLKINKPIGMWSIGYETCVGITGSVAAASIFAELSTSASASTDRRMSAAGYAATPSQPFLQQLNRSKSYPNTDATTYYLIYKTDVSSSGTIQVYASDRGDTSITANNNYI